MKWEIEEPLYPHMPIVELYRDSGVFKCELDGELVVGVSANNWEDYLGYLREVDLGESCIVSPELITCAGMSFEDLLMSEGLVNQRIDCIVEVSKRRKNSYFLLGTPLFVNEKPRNSALVIKAGEIVGVTNKRCGATEEESNFFEMIPEESPLLLPNTNIGVLICSDLALASLYKSCNNSDLNEVLRVSGRAALVGKSVSCISDNAKALLVLSCWSVGGRFVDEQNKDVYYKNQLLGIGSRVMRGTNVKKIMMIDRVPTNLTEDIAKLTPNRPYNGVISPK